MLLSTCTLLVVLVTTTQVEAASALAESVMERPAQAKVVEARGAENEGDGDLSVSARQGVPGGMANVITLTLNALNPIPYLIGGINGMRHVMQHRLHPFQSMNARYIPRPNKFKGGRRPPFSPRPGSGKFRVAPGGLRFGGGGGVASGVSGVGGGASSSAGGGMLSGSSGGGVGAFVNDGGGGGDGNGGGSGNGVRGGSGGDGSGNADGMHANSHDMKTPEEGFLRQVRGTRLEYNQQVESPSFSTRPPQSRPPLLPSVSDINQNQYFGTLKPHSIITNRPNFPYLPSNITFPPSLLTTTIPKPKAVGTEAVGSGTRENKLTRVISIRVPEEMQDLAILEINMKTNGDISLSGGSTEEQKPRPHVRERHPRPPGAVPTPTYTAPAPVGLLPSLTEVFDEDYRLNNFDSNFQDPIFRRDVVTGIEKGSDIQDIVLTSYSANQLQDAFRMQTAEDTNPALLNALPVDLSSVRNLQPVVVSNKGMQISNPIASLPNLPAGSNLNNYYIVPLGASPSSSDNTEVLSSRPLIPIQRQESHVDEQHSAVYYIDITIPGTSGHMPSVNAKRLSRRKRNLDFDGWFPMDVSNPMLDDPTLAYQPPPLERVHFSNDPVNEKPLYPVRPENPTVFVVRSEQQEPEYHSVYGTENVEYYHINPQSNTVRAFRSPSFTVDEANLVPTQTETTPPITTQVYDDSVDESSKTPETNLDIPNKDEGFSDKSDNVYESTEPSNIESIANEKKNCEADSERDMEGAFSEYRPSVIERPDLLYLLRDRRKKVIQTPNTQGQRRRTSLPRRRQDTLSVHRSSDPPSSRLPLYELLGNRPRKSKDEVAPYLGSATDSAGASFVREIPPPNFRYSSQRTASSRHSPVTSRAGDRGSSSRNPVSPTRPWYLIDTRSSDSSRKREPSIASYIIPETLSDDKVHYKPQGPVSYVNNKQIKTLSDLIDNPHLDDHMNSYKPTLTANSLSELLQIFRYTQVTNGPGEAVTEEPVTVREFRYTRPTDETPTTDIFPSSFRYTPSPSKFSDPITEAGITEKPPARTSDAVADTNSLDGYLFSDSVASPEYANPRVRSNDIVSESKNASKDKGAARGTSKVKITANLVQRTSVTPATLKDIQVIYPGPAPSRKTSTSSPQYVIYQGHSKVKVFGVNSAEEDDWSKMDASDIFMDSTQSAFSPNTTVAPLASVTASLPTITSSSFTTTPSLTPLPSTELTISSTISSPVDQSTTPSAVDHTTLSDYPEATLPTTVSEEYDYYYADGDYGVTDLAFGDYQAENLGQPLIYVPGQLPPPPGLAHLSNPPLQPLIGDGHNSDYFFDQSAVREPPHLEDSFPLALTPAVALTQADVSGDRLVVLAEQQGNTSKDNQFSQPAEIVTETTNTSITTEGDAEGDRGT